MPLQFLDHVNIKTAELDEMVKWYGDVLGMGTGWRPDFPFGGAWLYLGDRPVVHLVEVETAAKGIDPRIEHFAFRADGMAEFIENLDRRNIDYSTDAVPGAPIVQVNLFDIAGNHIHVDFSKEEADTLA